MKVDNVSYLPASNNIELPSKPAAINVDAPENQQIKENLAKPTEQERNLMSVGERSVIEAIEKANKITIDHNTRAEFSVHEKTKDIIIKIVDNENGEVIREFPPKKFLDMIAKLWDLAGIMVDERR